jgi:hypothetical protein
VITTYPLDKFPTERNESVKAKWESFESNTITVTAPEAKTQVDENGDAIDFASRELIVTINGNKHPVYNVYGMDNHIISSPGKQVLEVKFADGTSVEGVKFEYIYPTQSDSMLIPVKEEEVCTNTFYLRDSYFPTLDSNTITVKAKVNEYVYSGTITPTFGY